VRADKAVGQAIAHVQDADAPLLAGLDLQAIGLGEGHDGLGLPHLPGHLVDGDIEVCEVAAQEHAVHCGELPGALAATVEAEARDGQADLVPARRQFTDALALDGHALDPGVAIGLEQPDVHGRGRLRGVLVEPQSQGTGIAGDLTWSGEIAPVRRPIGVAQAQAGAFTGVLRVEARLGSIASVGVGRPDRGIIELVKRHLGRHRCGTEHGERQEGE